MSIQLTVEVQEVQVLMGALGKLPLESSLDLWAKIKGQTEQQLQAQQAASAAQAAADAPAAE
jgi:hypothetical protein